VSEAIRPVAADPERPAAALPIRLIALDIDGTLIGEDLLLRDRTVAAVRAARHRGVSVSLVTGRMSSSAIVFARQLGLTDPIVAYQGALIRALRPGDDERLGRLLRHQPLGAEAAREVTAWARTVGLEPHVNHLERFVIQADDPRAEDYSTFLGSRAEIVPDLSAWLTHPVSKVLAVAVEPLDDAGLADVRRRFAGRAEVTISHPRFLEFLSPGVTKLVGVRHLARRAHVPLANVLAIGDNFNDLEMLASVGHGAAMPSAPAPVRAAARYVAPPLAEEGAAQMIERLVLAGPAAAARNADALAEEHDAMGALGRDAPDDLYAPDAANDEGTPRGESSERSPTPIGARRA
jgi:Cof subfamily protein (haloacid dehalogenase superfamily)